MIFLKRMAARKWNTLFLTIVFIILFTVLPYGFHLSWEANDLLMANIETIERGSYDLLIRPGLSSEGQEATLQMIDQSFAENIGGYSFYFDDWDLYEHDPVRVPLLDADGNPTGMFADQLEALFSIPNQRQLPLGPPFTRAAGFTYDQWQDFVRDPRVEIAAPIAVFGMMEGMEQTLEVPDGFGSISFYTTDGLQDFLLAAHDLQDKKEVELPSAFHFLVAVEAALEQKMTGVDLSPLLEQDGGFPILQRNRLTTPLYAALGSGEGIKIDLSPYLEPFRGGQLMVNPEGGIISHPNAYPHSLPEEFLVLGQVEYRVPATPEYVEPLPMHQGPLSVQLIADEDIPVHRRRTTMTFIGEQSEPFLMEVVGTFDPYQYTPPLQTAAPLGVYSTLQAVHESGADVVPTAMPGSFLPQTASGITTLEAARNVKGETFIDAIRIRLAGIEAFDAQARQKILDFANELNNEWIDVQIVAGSALTTQELDVEGVGNLHIPWILAGAVVGMARNFNILTFTTMTLFSVFMLVWLATRLKAENSLLGEESRILAHIGWTAKEIRTHELRSQQIFLVGLNLVSLFLLFVMEAPLMAYGISIGLLLCSLTVPYLIHAKPRLNIWKKPFKAGQAVNYYWHYYMPIIVLLWLSYQVITIIASSQFRVFLNFNATDLGQGLIGPVNSLMVFLLVLAYVMTALAVFEAISVILKKRRDEFVLYRLVGWKPREVYFHLVRESTGWLLHPLLSAAAISIAISLLLSFIAAGAFVAFILAALLVEIFRLLTSKRITWNLTTWNWALVISFFVATLSLAAFYSSSLVWPTILISFSVLLSMIVLILGTIYISFRSFYKSI